MSAAPDPTSPKAPAMAPGANVPVAPTPLVESLETEFERLQEPLEKLNTKSGGEWARCLLRSVRQQPAPDARADPGQSKLDWVDWVWAGAQGEYPVFGMEKRCLLAGLLLGAGPIVAFLHNTVDED